MKNILLYHGSINIIEKPIYGFGKEYNDYGKGFYLTEDIELAKEWASVSNDRNGYINKYILNIENLNILDLTNPMYSVLNWMAILVKNREFPLNSLASKKRKDFLIDNYYIDTQKYDVIIGYRADDSYFRFAKDFLNNSITIEKLSKAMELGKLGKQVVLISEKAFNSIKFIDNELVDSNIYFTKRFIRDQDARNEYLNSDDYSEGTYLSEIIGGKVNGN